MTHVRHICGALNENGSDWLLYLNAWFPVGGIVCEGLQGVALLNEVWPCGGGGTLLEEVWPCEGGVVLWRRCGLVEEEWSCGGGVAL